MLLPPNRSLRRSAVFAGLYALKLEVIRASCTGRAVTPSAMPTGLWAVVQDNTPTRTVLAILSEAIQNLPELSRYELWLLTWSAPKISDLMSDTTLPIPEPPQQIITHLKRCVEHLFDHTSTLAGVIAACGESIHDFFMRYSANKPIGNGNVCNVCCTEFLAQRRNGIPSQAQWRAEFDHLLAEAQYPLISLDPINLLPVCHHCNSKAKLTEDLIRDKKNTNQARLL